jgi:hypothetical protein
MDIQVSDTESGEPLVMIFYYCFSSHSPNDITSCMIILMIWSGRRGRDRMVVGFTTTYVISAFHH